MTSISRNNYQTLLPTSKTDRVSKKDIAQVEADILADGEVTPEEKEIVELLVKDQLRLKGSDGQVQKVAVSEYAQEALQSLDKRLGEMVGDVHQSQILGEGQEQRVLGVLREKSQGIKERISTLQEKLGDAQYDLKQTGFSGPPSELRATDAQVGRYMVAYEKVELLSLQLENAQRELAIYDNAQSSLKLVSQIKQVQSAQSAITDIKSQLEEMAGRDVGFVLASKDIQGLKERLVGLQEKLSTLTKSLGELTFKASDPANERVTQLLQEINGLQSQIPSLMIEIDIKLEASKRYDYEESETIEREPSTLETQPVDSTEGQTEAVEESDSSEETVETAEESEESSELDEIKEQIIDHAKDGFIEAEEHLPEEFQDIIAEIKKAKDDGAELKEKLVGLVEEYFKSERTNYELLETLGAMGEVLGDDFKELMQEHIKLLPDSLEPLANNLLDKSLKSEDRQKLLSSLKTLSEEGREWQKKDFDALLTIASVFKEDAKALVESQLGSKIPESLQGVLSIVLDKGLSEGNRETVLKALDTLSNGEYGLEDLGAIGELATIYSDEIGAGLTQVIQDVSEPLKSIAETVISKGLDEKTRQTVIDSVMTLADDKTDKKDLEAVIQLAGVFKGELTGFYDKYLADKVPEGVRDITVQIVRKGIEPANVDAVLQSLDTLSNGEWGVEDVKALGNLASLYSTELQGMLSSRLENFPEGLLKDVASLAVEKGLDPKQNKKIVDSLATLTDGETNKGDLKAVMTLASVFKGELSGLYDKYLADKVPDGVEDIVVKVVQKGIDDENLDTVLKSLDALTDGKWESEDISALGSLASLYSTELKDILSERVGQFPEGPLKTVASMVIDKGLDPEQNQAIVENLVALTDGEWNKGDIKALIELKGIFNEELNDFYNSYVSPKIPESIAGVLGDIVNEGVSEKNLDKVISSLDTLSDGKLDAKDIEALGALSEVYGRQIEQGLMTLAGKLEEPTKGFAEFIITNGMDADVRQTLVENLLVLTDGQLGAEDLKAVANIAQAFPDQLQGLIEDKLISKLDKTLQPLARKAIELSADPKKLQNILTQIDTLTDGEMNYEDVKAAIELGKEFGEALSPFVNEILDRTFDTEETKTIKTAAKALLKVATTLSDDKVRAEALKNFGTLTDSQFGVEDLSALTDLLKTFDVDVAKDLLAPLLEQLPEGPTKDIAQVLVNISDKEKLDTIMSNIALLTQEDRKWDIGDGVDEELKDIKAVMEVLTLVGGEMADTASGAKLVNALLEKVPKIGDYVSFNDKTHSLKIDIPVQGKDGRGGKIGAEYNFKDKTYALDIQAGQYNKDSSAKLAGSVGFSYSATPALEAFGDDGFTKEVDINDTEYLTDDAKHYLETAAVAYGLDPKNIDVVLNVTVDKDGNASVSAVLQSKTASGNPPRYAQVKLGLDADVPELAKDLGIYLAKKYGPALAAKLGPAALASVSKAIPVIGQLVTAAQVGWEIGRLIGENVMIDGKSVDDHMQEMFKAALYEGPGANSEARQADFKAGIATLRTAFNDAVHKNGLIEGTPAYQALESMIALKITAYTAMANPYLVDDEEKKVALEKVDLLQNTGALSPEDADALREQIGMADGGMGGRSEWQEKVRAESSDAMNRLSPSQTNASDAKDIAIDLGRDIVMKLRGRHLSSEQAGVLLNEIRLRLQILQVPESEIKSIETAIANFDQRGDENRTSNTIALELGAAKWIEDSVGHLKDTSKGIHSALDKAIQDGDQGTVDALIEAGEIDERGDYGDTALAMAVKRGDIDSIQMLIEAGANLDIPNGEGETPLMIAAQSGDIAILDLLVKAGADPNLKNNEGETILMQLFHSRGDLPNIDVLESIIKSDKLDIEATDSRGDTALMYAVRQNQYIDDDGELFARVSLLVDKGHARVDARQDFGQGRSVLEQSPLNRYIESGEMKPDLIHRYLENKLAQQRANP